MVDVQKMLELATEVMQNAYAPYSHFKVGAVVKSSGGNYYVGCNVENVSFSSTCAEDAAIAAMVAAGEHEIEEILIVTGGDELLAPCGSCRQKIREFAGDKTKIHMYNIDGRNDTVHLRDLLPMSFAPRKF
ncbi:MAG: cytidine deaminase [Alphaproteobacteria bacterium]|nr:cytidine deaminase [Alphaproteobacteria bacterium]